MSGSRSDKRAAKKEIRKHFEKIFDIKTFDYPQLIKPIKGKALIYGFVSAGGIYILAYGLAYFAFSSNILPLEALAKLVWIMMIPSTVLGFLMWIITRNRLEYPIRQQIRAHMDNLESNQGQLWRFKPVWDHFDGHNMDVKKAFTASETHQCDKLDIEDYTLAITSVHQIFQNYDAKDFSSDLAQKVVDNLRQ
ncbi:MAG: hypothetical protein OEZ58_11925 [Gammaproteobacteria bacterium]|nr:hypothetical protein [Gammaproteobacteria bacterium]MDH5729691.1 hypothetical protein [Gammaproteobacteria bacterium]